MMLNGSKVLINLKKIVLLITIFLDQDHKTSDLTIQQQENVVACFYSLPQINWR